MSSFVPKIQYEDLRILIVEDDPLDAELMEDELRQAGWVLISQRVDDRDSYLRALGEFRPDIILSDYDLPDFTGYEALQIRKKLFPAIPFVLVTGAIGEERAIEILTGGATDYILKRNLTKLAPAVHRALHETYEHQKRKEAEAERDTLLKDLERRVQERTEALQGEITERQRAEREREILQERLQRAEKMEALGLMAGGVAHDLNNVLGVLVGYSDLILCSVEENDPICRHAKNILKAGERAASIVQDLLTLARRGVQNEAPVNLNTIVMEYLRSPDYMNMTSHYQAVRVKAELEDGLLPILGSASHLTKSLMNLVLNAAEAMPQGGEVVIRTRNCHLDRPLAGYDTAKIGDYAVLSISDEGAGITEDEMKHIFEPFYTKRIMGRRGTGIGLAVVWGTIKDHEGYIDVQSEPGRGTTFTLYFPVTRVELAEEAVPPDVSSYMGRGEKILVVDDTPEQRELAGHILTQLNYSVETVDSGEQAVDYLRDHTVDLVMLDMIMDPGIDGLETYRRIIEFRPGQKAVIVSGYAETERVRMAQALGVGDYVRKPYIRERIGRAIRKTLDKK